MLPCSNTFCKVAHIRKRVDFMRAQKNGKRQNQKHLMVVFILNGEKNARLGIVATTKIGNAVCRNRGKRLVREAFRRNQNLFPNNLDIVVILHKGIELASQSEIDIELIQSVKNFKYKNRKR